VEVPSLTKVVGNNTKHTSVQPHLVVKGKMHVLIFCRKR
jgi:hypothetical protein